MDQKGFIAMTPYSEQVEREIGAIQHSITTGIAQLREMVRTKPYVAPMVDRDWIEADLVNLSGLIGDVSIEQARLAREEARAAA